MSRCSRHWFVISNVKLFLVFDLEQPWKLHAPTQRGCCFIFFRSYYISINLFLVGVVDAVRYSFGAKLILSSLALSRLDGNIYFWEESLDSFSRARCAIDRCIYCLYVELKRFRWPQYFFNEVNRSQCLQFPSSYFVATQNDLCGLKNNSIATAYATATRVYFRFSYLYDSLSSREKKTFRAAKLFEMFSILLSYEAFIDYGHGNIWKLFYFILVWLKVLTRFLRSSKFFLSTKE